MLPGLLFALMMSLFVIIRALAAGVRTTAQFNFRHLLRTTWQAIPALFMPVFVLSGIYLGWSSPTEAGGFACLYAILVGRYVYRTMSGATCWTSASRSALVTAQIMVIVAAASLFSWILTINGVPQALTAGLKSLDLRPGRS